MRKLPKRTLGIALLVLVLLLAGFGWWWTDLRWRPKTLATNGAEIAALLDNAGWVSPGLSDTKVLYLVGFRSCPDCIRFETEEFPRLQAARATQRVIL